MATLKIIKYDVSEDGAAVSTNTKGIKYTLTQHTDRKGYSRVMLCLDGKRTNKRVHRLVAEKFIPNTHNKPHINHKDGNTLNNHYTNLEWCTNKENAEHGKSIGQYRNRNNHVVNIDDASEMAEAYATGMFTQKEIAEGFGYKHSTVSYYLRRAA